MQKSILLGFAIIVISACNQQQKPSLVYEDAGHSETAELKKDSTLIELADIPIHIDSTTYLIHPVGTYSIHASRGKYYFGASDKNSGSFKVSNQYQHQLSGNLHNLKFQKLDSEKLTTLTTKNIRIQSVAFLRDIFNQTQKQILLYHVRDKDTNQDHQIDENDVEALYISNIDGSEFRKITAAFHELIDWKEVGINKRVYFRSVEDSNKNGEFDQKDKVHYQYIDFSKDKYTVTEYSPL